MTSILMDHNVETHEQAISTLAKEHKVAIVQPTGTGKSYLLMSILNNEMYRGLKKIVVAPSREFLNTLEENEYWNSTDTFTFTYQWLTLNRKHLRREIEKIVGDLSRVGIVAFDEVHRAGAEYWEAVSLHLVSMCENADMLGLTATPIRSDSRNMVEELFDGLSVGNKSLKDVIEAKILPKMHYVEGVATADIEIEKFEKKYERHKYIIDKMADTIEEVREAWQPYNTFLNVLRKHLIKEGVREGLEGRHIVFMRTIDEVDEYRPIIEDWFKEIYPGYEVNAYAIHSKSTKNSNSAIIRKFSKPVQKNCIDIMITVQMVGESFHFKNIKSVTMFRRTQAISVFIQQVGRALSADGESPYIFDFVDNFDRIGDVAFLAGGSYSDNLGVIFESFSDETAGCKTDIDKIKLKLNNRVNFYREALYKYALKYKSLYLIPDKELRDWAVGQFRWMMANNHPSYINHKDAYKFTYFMTMETRPDWIADVQRYNELDEDKKQSVIKITTEMLICGTLDDPDIKEFARSNLGFNIDTLINIDTLLNYIKEGKSKECKSSLGLLEAVKEGNYFKIWDYLDRCKLLYKEGMSERFSCANISTAAAYQCYKLLQTDIKVIELSNMELNDDDLILCATVGKAKLGRRVNITSEEFKKLNLGFLSRDVSDNSQLIIDMLHTFDMKKEDVVAYLNKLTLFEHQIQSIATNVEKLAITDMTGKINGYSNVSMRTDRFIVESIQRRLDNFESEYMFYGLHDSFKGWYAKYKDIIYDCLCYLTYNESEYNRYGDYAQAQMKVFEMLQSSRVKNTKQLSDKEKSYIEKDFKDGEEDAQKRRTESIYVHKHFPSGKRKIIEDATNFEDILQLKPLVFLFNEEEDTENYKTDEEIEVEVRNIRKNRYIPKTLNCNSSMENIDFDLEYNADPEITKVLRNMQLSKGRIKSEIMEVFNL